MLLILSSSYWYENWGLGSLRNILKLTLLVRWCYPFHCTLLPPGFYFLPASSPRVWIYLQFLHMDMGRFPKPVTTWEWILCIDFGLPRAMPTFSFQKELETIMFEQPRYLLQDTPGQNWTNSWAPSLYPGKQDTTPSLIAQYFWIPSTPKPCLLKSHYFTINLWMLHHTNEKEEHCPTINSLIINYIILIYAIKFEFFYEI